VQVANFRDRFFPFHCRRKPVRLHSLLET
jgi:hypothetical protein